jgi:hypothetical protein
MKELTVDLIEALSGVFLSPRYDSPQPTPDFHRECWARYCGPHPACATAAPRNHAKSTALTHDYILANALFRIEPYIILVGSSEDMAIEHLGDIANELSENDDIIREFKIKEFKVSQKTDIIIECVDGYQFRIIARGAEQKIRGRKWNGRRPGLIVFDDIEDDEQVESRDRRKKFRRWFFRACKQALRDGGKIRGHGTILHEDSLLNRLMKNKEWNSRVYKAHAAFDDFSQILWPEKFPEARLRGIRQEFINEGDSAGYAQEYLNDPFDNDEAFIRSEDLLPMEEGDFAKQKQNGVGVDFAISKADSANKTAFVVAGKDTENLLHFVDCRSGRWDILEIVDQFFMIQIRHNPLVFFVEDGVIWKAVWTILKPEMLERDIFINVEPIMPIKDKKVRGRSFQKRTRVGGCRFDKEASWYPEFEEIILRFTGDSEAVRDDEFDAAALVSKGFESYSKTEADDFMTEEEEQFMVVSEGLRGGGGRSMVTGY